MFKFIINTIFQQNKMHESTLDLFCESNDDEQIADEYAMEIEMKAAFLEVTVDYYMMEFM
jgi:hypothetical protein